MSLGAKVGVIQGRYVVITLDDENVACLQDFRPWNPKHILGLIDYKISQSQKVDMTDDWWRSIDPGDDSDSCQNRGCE